MNFEWLEETYAKIRTLQITPENTWLVGAAAALAVELTTAYKRIEELEAQIPRTDPPTLLEILAGVSDDEA
jgi:hypothetical protein